MPKPDLHIDTEYIGSDQVTQSGAPTEVLPENVTLSAGRTKQARVEKVEFEVERYGLGKPRRLVTKGKIAK